MCTKLIRENAKGNLSRRRPLVYMKKYAYQSNLRSERNVDTVGKWVNASFIIGGARLESSRSNLRSNWYIIRNYYNNSENIKQEKKLGRKMLILKSRSIYIYSLNWGRMNKLKRNIKIIMGPTCLNTKINIRQRICKST